MARLLLAVSAVMVMLFVSTSPAAGGSDVVEVAVTFDVVNTNRSRVACISDGAQYRLHATIVAPARLLEGGRLPAATLYVHGLGLSSYVWRFDDVPGYDHAVEMARMGHVSVVYDRLGYGDNPKPDGLQSCYGSEADVVDQVVRALKSGAYDAVARPAPAVDEVVVVGHSQAGLIVQPYAYSFTSHDGLVVVSWADEGNRPAVSREAIDTAQACLAGGEQPEDGERPPFYAFYPNDDATFHAFYFHSTDPAVRDAATRRQEPDPCGNGGSLAQTLLVDQTALGDIDVPVLLVYGMHDGYRPQPDSGHTHAEKFTGSPSVTLEFVDDAGNALPLERAAPRFRSSIAAWLCDHMFAAEHACRPTPNPSASEGQRPNAPTDRDRTPLPTTGGSLALGSIPLIGAAIMLARRLGQAIPVPSGTREPSAP